MQVPVLFVGEAERTEFRRVLDHLHQSGPVVTARDLAAAEAALVQCPGIQRILIAPSYRNEFSERGLRRLSELQPLAEMVVLVGPWIEGETRSGRPWLPARRFYLHQAVAWLRATQLTSSSRTAGLPAWRPATLSADEAWQLAAELPWPQPAGLVIVCSELPESRQTLADVCTAAGLRTLGQRPSAWLECTRVDAVIYDAVADRAQWAEHLRELTERYRPRALVVLMNFPRPDECEWMRGAGASEVLGKPFQLDHLLASLVAAADPAARAVA
jgi:hypothetical protein